MRPLFILTLFFLLGNPFMYAQEWVLPIYPEDGASFIPNAMGLSVAATHDGGVLVKYSSANESDSSTVVKLDGNGNIEWEANLGINRGSLLRVKDDTIILGFTSDMIVMDLSGNIHNTFDAGYLPYIRKLEFHPVHGFIVYAREAQIDYYRYFDLEGNLIFGTGFDEGFYYPLPEGLLLYPNGNILLRRTPHSTGDDGQPLDTCFLFKSDAPG